MGEQLQQKIVLHRWRPQSLESLSLDIVIEALLRLNDSKIDPQFPWLSKKRNPFICLPQNVIEVIMDLLADELYVENEKVQKELLRILICKPLKNIHLSHFNIEKDDILDVLRTLESTSSKLSYLEVNTLDLKNEYNPWIKVPEAMTFLKKYVKSMPSLTHLNLNGICDDELLEAVALGCPNLLVLWAESENITNEGLKRLCMNTNNAEDDSKRCQKLKKISLDPNKGEDYLSVGIEIVLIHLPSLQMLECSNITLGKVIEKLHEKKKFQLREFCYDGSFHYSCLPSIIALRCPFLTTLRFENNSNVDLMRFERIQSLRDLLICTTDNLLTFEDGIAPFLDKMGKHLEALSLRDVADIDYNVIEEHCPNLTRLDCHSKGALTGKISMNPVFSNMEELYLDSSINIGLQPRDCIRLLSNCYHLRYVSLSCCEDFNKGHLKEILVRNPLSLLNSVDISSSTLWIDGQLSDLKWICN